MIRRRCCYCHALFLFCSLRSILRWWWIAYVVFLVAEGRLDLLALPKLARCWGLGGKERRGWEKWGQSRLAAALFVDRGTIKRRPRLSVTHT